ncbi:type III secretion protein [Pseudomonas floridensis]|uniref:Type III secretion protein n=1 Tax=Pseudomonas floridensis TaxID=1958950 RepID=A0A1X0N6I3_9PSED|nr:type III secretion system stator protein SctL [Pseudomonas floridensis]ORC59104.1 type III secretion protein [Pseudomonas floridensis]
MLAKRSIALTNAALLPEPIMRREAIADSLLAQDILANAHVQARQMLSQQQEEADRRQQQALAEFWTSANAFLAELQAQRQVLQQQVMESLEHLLTDALKQLLDETSLAERARALSRNLAASQLNEVGATLSVHPDIADSVAEWLTKSRFVEHWQLKRDASMPRESLRLSDANGAFDIDWVTLRNGLTGCNAST